MPARAEVPEEKSLKLGFNMINIFASLAQRI
jgi:hypothetical protein